jgi:hypothetical protein
MDFHPWIFGNPGGLETIPADTKKELYCKPISSLSIIAKP